MPSEENLNTNRAESDGAHALVLSGVTHAYGAGNVVEEVDLAAATGQIVSVVGPSGCGKSTILRIASGLLEPASGTVFSDPRNTGVVMQDPQLLPWRTVLENVALPGELRGQSKQDRHAVSHDVLKLVGLSDAAGLFPSELSGGMKMRVAVARALTLTPQVLLLDEPFGSLDDITRHALNSQLLEIQRARNIAALFITHSISEAVFVSSSVVVMTAQPGRVHARFAVPFSDRTPELRFDPAFNQLCSQVSKALSEASLTSTGEGKR